LCLGYPFLQEAKIVAVSDELFKYMVFEDQIIPVPHSPAELSGWSRKSERIEEHYSNRMGIVTGPVQLLFHVEMLKGMLKTEEGAIIKEYGSIPGVETDYAAQTIVWNVVSEDQRFLERAPLPIEEEFPEGSRAFFLGEFNYGRPLEVVGHAGGRTDIWVSTMVTTMPTYRGNQTVLISRQQGKEPGFAKQFIRRAELSTPYTPSYLVARKLGLNTLVLSKITASFQVHVGDQRVNLGLNLKFESKKMKVLGYSRKTQGGWEFSNKAIALIKDYKKSFPQFFNALMRNPQGDLYKDTDFFDPRESKQKINEIKDWLKTIDSKGFEKVPLEAMQLDGDVVMQIEQAMDAHNGGPQVPMRVKNVPRRALLKPVDAEHQLAHQRFALGDRVVYVQDTGKVPIALRGTVIGLTRTARVTLLDVVWDLTFMSGTTLGGRCSPFRGMTVPVSSTLNLTDRQLIASTVASARFKPAPPPAPLTSSYADATMGPASSSPSPQPTNGFRGGRGGGRGRSSYDQPQQQPGRGSFVQRDSFMLSRRSGPPGAPMILPRGGAQGAHRSQRASNGQQATNAPQYQAVPPPPAILQRGRGGARAGRGFRGRFATAGERQ